jgi:hypothetical protein
MSSTGTAIQLLRRCSRRSTIFYEAIPSDANDALRWR